MNFLTQVNCNDGIVLRCVRRADWNGVRPALVTKNEPNADQTRIMAHVHERHFTDPKYVSWWTSNNGDYVWFPYRRPGTGKYLVIGRHEQLGEIGLLKREHWDRKFPAFFLHAGSCTIDQIQVPSSRLTEWQDGAKYNGGGSHVWVPLSREPKIVSVQWAYEKLVFRQCEHDKELVAIGESCEACRKRAITVDRINHGPMTGAEREAWSTELRKRLGEREEQRRQQIGCQGSLPTDLLGYDV